MILQVITLVGSLSVLAGYFLNQQGYVQYNSWSYMLPNILGSVLLGSVSIYVQLWGYVLLNVVWGVITLNAIYKKVRSNV